jgi:hypothetical protein
VGPHGPIGLIGLDPRRLQGVEKREAGLRPEGFPMHRRTGHVRTDGGRLLGQEVVQHHERPRVRATGERALHMHGLNGGLGLETAEPTDA